MSTQETESPKAKHGKGQAARNAAVKKLIEEFPDRWSELHAEERKVRGLFPVLAKQPNREELKAQVEKLRAALLAQGVNPDEV